MNSTKLMSVGFLIFGLSSAASALNKAVVTCQTTKGQLTLSFDSSQPAFKYEFVGDSNHEFESVAENAWAEQHSSMSLQETASELVLKAEIASEDSSPVCVPVPNTRKCNGYKPGYFIETAVELKLDNLGHNLYILNEATLFHFGGYDLKDFYWHLCTVQKN